MFSKRTRWDRTVNRVTALLEEKRRDGVTVLDLTESNPTLAGFLPPIDVLGSLATSAALRYEPAPRGLAIAREAVARDYLRRDVWIDPEQIVLTASTSEAYGFLFKLLCDTGDDVLVPTPSYPLFEYLAGLEDVAAKPYRLQYDGEWHLSAQAVEERLGDRTRAIVVVNPNNPTGSFLKVEEGRSLLDLCAERGIALVGDEVFADYGFEADSHRVSTVSGEGPALTFALGGLSKSCGLPQLKLAWIVVSGPRPQRDEALARLEVIADTYLSVGTPVQHAAPDLLERARRFQLPIATRLRENLEMLKAISGGRPDVSVLTVEGGWNAVVRVPATLPEEELVLMLLRTQDVLVHPGYFFDFAHEAYLVVSLLTRREWFTVGIDRILSTI